MRMTFLTNADQRQGRFLSAKKFIEQHEAPGLANQDCPLRASSPPGYAPLTGFMTDIISQFRLI